jgi:tetraacyldisaccharide 4'-kinase
LEPRLRRWWSNPDGAGELLMTLALPAELAYRLAVGLRNTGYDAGLLRPRTSPLPAVSVGNLTVGGTGKTPVSAWIVGRLLALGARPAVLLRGYGDDEVQLHRRWNPSVPVLPDPDRARSATAALGLGANVVVLDDGFQHRRLARDLDVLLIAAEQPFPGRQLPRGPFREAAACLRRADLLLVTRRTASEREVEARLRVIERFAGGKPLARVRLAAGAWTTLGGDPTTAPRGEVLAVTSVAEPELFRRMVAEAADGSVELMAFPDHHEFDARDTAAIARAARGREIAVTEKDAVKLNALTPLRPATVRVLALSVRLVSGADHIEQALRRVAESARSHGHAVRPLETDPRALASSASELASGMHA